MDACFFSVQLVIRRAFPALFEARPVVAGVGGFVEQDFSAVAEKTGTYTAMDYADIVDYLVKRWDIENLKGSLTGEAAAAQEYVIKLPNREWFSEGSRSTRDALGGCCKVGTPIHVQPFFYNARE